MNVSTTNAKTPSLLQNQMAAIATGRSARHTIRMISVFAGITAASVDHAAKYQTAIPVDAINVTTRNAVKMAPREMGEPTWFGVPELGDLAGSACAIFVTPNYN